MLEYNKNYAILALNCILKNSKETISVLEVNRRDRNNNIKRNIRVASAYEHFLLLIHS